MKLSVVIPVYYNEDNLIPLYDDLKEKIFSKIDYDYELIFVNDGSKDNSFGVMKKLASFDKKIKIYSLSRNFGSHAAVLCGLSHASGDCVAIKAADLQEPSELLLDMVKAWQEGNNVVLATREDREESFSQKFFANSYYSLVRKTSLPNMPKNGFDIFLIDKKVVKILIELNERNSSINGQILWSGFKTAEVPYVRKAREIGKSKWTLKKKLKLVADTVFSFSTLPIKIIGSTGFLACIISVVSFIINLLAFNTSNTLIISFMLLGVFLFGTIMISIGILGEYLWRTLDSARNRQVFIEEYSMEDRDDNRENI